MYHKPEFAGYYGKALEDIWQEVTSHKDWKTALDVHHGLHKLYNWKARMEMLLEVAVENLRRLEKENPRLGW
jgi:hypothetical protein